MKLINSALCMLAACLLASCTNLNLGSAKNTPASAYASDLPYKFVYVDGEVFLKFTGSDSSPFGPFEMGSDDGHVEYSYADPRGGVHSVDRNGDEWRYTWSYIHMESMLVDASELATLRGNAVGGVHNRPSQSWGDPSTADQTPDD